MVRPVCDVMLLFLGFIAASAKVQRGFVTLGVPQVQVNFSDSRNQWHFLGKFGYAIGTGHYEIRLRLETEIDERDVAPRPDLDIYLDEEWPRAENYEVCNRAAQVPARKSHSRLDVGHLGKWGPWYPGALFQNVRPHIWYFVLSDCHSRYWGNSQVEYEIRWKQHDESEFSLEMRYIPVATMLSFAGLSVLFSRLAMKGRQLQLGVGQLHPIIYALGIAMTLQLVSQMLHLLHLWIYSYDGVGLHSLDLMADILFMLCQVASASLLISIAQGYTLVRSKLSEVELLTPVVSVVALIHIALVAISKHQGEASCKYHEHEGLIGWILLLVRISLFAWFRAGVKNLQSTGSFRLQNFLQHFELAGSAYFLSFPLLFMAVQVFAPYLQHPILQTGQLIMQTASWLWLADLFFGKGSFFEISDLSASLLPGSGLRSYSPLNFKKDA